MYDLTHYFQCALFPMKFSSKHADDQHSAVKYTLLVIAAQ